MTCPGQGISMKMYYGLLVAIASQFYFL